MNFQKTSKRPLTTPTLFSENYVALFATKFFGVQRPHPFSLPKKRNKIFRIGNDPPPPPLRKFSENSSNLVQVLLPKGGGGGGEALVARAY